MVCTLQNQKKTITANLLRLKKQVFDVKKLYPSVTSEEYAAISFSVNKMFIVLQQGNYEKLQNLLLAFRGLIYIMSDSYPDAAYALLSSLVLSIKIEKIIQEY